MYKLLVADDEYEIRHGLCTYFPWKEIGFEVVGQAENGRQALDFLKSQPVDVLLCDIIMPGMTGLDVARELQAQKSPVRVIFLSGFKDFEYAQKSIEYGVNSYILKSTDYNELIRVFSRVRAGLDEQHARTPAVPAVQEVPESALSFNDKIIRIIRQYVADHLRDVTLEDLTRQVHMNPDYISKFFKQKTGQNFSDYLMEIRMQTAARLLDDVRYKTYEISEMVGYSNSFNFTRTFKAYYGCNPREYRKRSGKNQDVEP